MKKFITWLFNITPADVAITVEPTEVQTVEVESPTKSDELVGGIDVSGRVRENGQIELKIDWNDEFIKELKANGYNGANEDVIIQQYLATLHRRLMEDTTGGDFN